MTSLARPGGRNAPSLEIACDGVARLTLGHPGEDLEDYRTELWDDFPLAALSVVDVAELSRARGFTTLPDRLVLPTANPLPMLSVRLRGEEGSESRHQVADGGPEIQK